LANASSVGAKTVNSPPLSVSTRFTFGFSCPDSAWVSVLSIGLLEAATVTGSAAMPVTEPGPDGTCSAYAAQLVPTRLAAGSAAALDGADDVALSAADDAALVADDALLDDSSLEHAAAPNTANALRPAAARALRWTVYLFVETTATPRYADAAVPPSW
jgi:hypothetical protein